MSTWKHRGVSAGFLCVLCLLLIACGGTAGGQTGTPTVAPVSLNVFAAASLTEVFTEMKTSYQHQHPNVTLTYNFAGSQALVQQMIQGAPADVFASADQTTMQKAKEGDVVGSSQIFARNKLTVIIPSSNPGHIQTLKDLAKPGLKIDMAAATVPVGKYGLQVLENLSKSSEYGRDYEQKVKANVVSQEDNVKAVVQKVQLGEADAGIVYLTDVTTAVASKVSAIAIPDAYNVIAQYPIAVTKKSTKEATNFVQYVLSTEGQSLLKKYHFLAAQ